MVDGVAFKYESNFPDVKLSLCTVVHYLTCYKLCLCLLLLSNFKVLQKNKK